MNKLLCMLKGLNNHIIDKRPIRTEEEKQARIVIIDEYLQNQCSILKKYYKHFPKRITPTSDYAAVIVEPRSDYKTLESICRNVMYFLPSHWNLIIYSYDEDTIKQRLKNMEYIFYKTEKSSLTSEEYSQLLMSECFWNNIPANNIIIFQTDSYITRHFTDDYIDKITKYPFIGALYSVHDSLLPHNERVKNICSVDNYRNYSMSGGFSFRNKKAMLDCIKNITLSDIINYRKSNKLHFIHQIGYEDLFFEHSLFLLGYTLPDEKVCIEFCCQLQYESTTTHSFHGIYRDYVYEYLIYMLMPSLYDMNDEIDKKIGHVKIRLIRN